MLKREYVWEIPVRLFHWINALSLLVLALTGFYIAGPVTLAWGEAYRSYAMGVVRFVHFVAAFVLLFNLVFRFYWAFVGNKYARWSGLLPVGKRLGDLVPQTLYYLLIRQEPPHYVGHNPLAGLSYVGLFVLLILQGLTGFALYGEVNPGGFYSGPFGWVLGLLGSQVTRFLHHILMWLIGIFFLVHLYIAIYYDLREKNGPMSSIVSGFKFISEQEE